MKSSGGNYKQPGSPQPQGEVTPYGQASQFNPQYQSVLPVDAAGNPVQTQTAQLTDPIRNTTGSPTPLLEQQKAQAIANQGRDNLASAMRTSYGQLSGAELLMMKLGRTPENFDPKAARNDALLRAFAGGMGGVGGGGSGRSSPSYGGRA